MWDFTQYVGVVSLKQTDTISQKATIFKEYEVPPSSLVDTHCLREVYCLHLPADRSSKLL
jgi:hypothetical protein